MQEIAPKRKVYIEKQLFERIRFGDQDAFRELYELTYTPLYAFLLSYTLNREDAQDLLQDTFIQILRKSHLYQDKGNPMAWMMKIAKNLFLSKCRKEHSENLNYEDVENDLGFDDMTNVDNRMVLEKMFEILSIDDRNLIIMHDVSGLKHKEIAEILDIPLGTVLARYHRGIRKLQKEFSERRPI
ncbi:MAG: RNA polymerase sigma factor [Lachnospiraceae bacterium]|nr:RNA polymerase sigma factor [Lachnospiraceae bacterium]